jgi:MFS family permease
MTPTTAKPAETKDALIGDSPWRPFRHLNYSVLWATTLVANTGAWMYGAAAAWLMTSLDPDPLMVSLVQVATTLPMFLFALPAGALADIVDKRRFLIVAECLVTVVATLFAILVWLDRLTPELLLLLTFLLEAAFAAASPAWQSIVPQLVPMKDLPPAVAMNSVGVNISRAIGPALAGVLTGAFGIAAPFWVNAAANLGSIGALSWWHSPRPQRSHVPVERFASAINTGVRHVRNNRLMRNTLIRATGFFISASCYWALLPLVARNQAGGGATLYGLMLGSIGASAIIGAFLLPRLKRVLGADRLVTAGTIGTAVAMLLFGSARGAATAFAASLVAGFCWMIVLATLNVSAQFSLPEWVRSRGLAAYVTIIFGAMALGSALWGEVASQTSVSLAHFIAAAGAVLVVPATWSRKLQSSAGLDLTPSLHWPTPIVNLEMAADAGPAMVTIEYRVREPERNAFLEKLRTLSRGRRRDGAFAWEVFEDVAEPGRFLEIYVVESWTEHLRQHERVTNADRVLEEEIGGLLSDSPKVTHFVAARRIPEPR